ncbi:MAG: PKD domain-containing protein, partial [Verrucomicrobiota bacterium]
MHHCSPEDLDAYRNAATTAGTNPNDYDFYIVFTDESPADGINFNYAGKAKVGQAGLHVVDPHFYLRVVGHELGHNLGLRHANYWRTDSDRPVGRDSVPGGYVGDESNDEWIEYGHFFSIMSAQNPSEFGHLAPSEKNFLDWIADSEVAVTTTSGVYRLARQDHQHSTGAVKAIHIDLPSSDDYYQREYWLNYRHQFPNNDWHVNGLQVDMQRFIYGADGAVQLDMTPFSRDEPIGNAFHRDNDDKEDGALLIGHTYSDDDAGIHITPLGKGGPSTNEWLDVEINIGLFPSNRAPELILTASTNAAGVGTPISFTATAGDPDGDELAVGWDFGDGRVHPPSLHQSNALK